jgi:hypothetical protein
MQGDGAAEHGMNGHTIMHDEVALNQMVQLRGRKSQELQTMCLSEKWRFVVLIGRIKETTQSLRRVHDSMAAEWSEVMGPDSPFTWSLTGDLKWLQIMSGHLGSGSTCPCVICCRTRLLMVILMNSGFDIEFREHAVGFCENSLKSKQRALKHSDKQSCCKLNCVRIPLIQVASTTFKDRSVSVWTNKQTGSSNKSRKSSRMRSPLVGR